MVSILQAIILGIVQGITEWLPISSSGHLVLFQKLFGIQPPVLFDIILHIGSLIVVFIVFWKDIVKLAKGLIKKEKASWIYLSKLLIASIPIALVGFFLNGFIKSIFHSTKTVGFSLLFTALLLYISKYPKKKNRSITFKNTFIMGIFQSLAILPGVSRSGSTISAGLLQGAKRQETARFSFLLFIPAILGATVMEITTLSQINGNLTALIIGTVFAIIAGVLSLKLLLKIINKNKFQYFSIYCLILGIILLFIAYA
ncbi:hypothetical protein GF361_03280 [Candidatus Woesearchaeota archaeon]|nr:hypothetical protein [Candidatus Woesearchaeota archaeon]